MSNAARPHLPRPLGGGWVFSKKSWFLFFLREITCVFVGLFGLLFILFVRAVAAGPTAYEEILAFLENPWVILFHVVSLSFLVFHTITWFVAAPKALRLRIGDNFVPPDRIVKAHYGAWAVVSAIVIWMLL